MLFNNQKGNIILEFLIYILICVIIFQGILNFLLISIKRNEMSKIANFISFSVAQDPTKFTLFSLEYQKELEKVLSPNLDFNYSIYCGQTSCSGRSSFAKVTLSSDFDYLMFKIPIKVSAQYQIGKFLSKN